MRKSLVVASLVVASTSMMAMDLQYFLGAGAEKANNTFKFSSDRYSELNGTDSLRDTSLLLKGGVILNKTHRISLSHTKFSKDDVDLTNITGNYDYLIPMNNQFRLYAGLHTGYAKVKIEGNFEDIKDNISFSGLGYGAQVGGIYDITKNIEFEAGLGYTRYNVDRTESTKQNASGTSTLYWSNMELDHSTSMFATLNYKF